MTDETTVMPDDKVREAAALAEFTDYFARNYPGPHTIIGNPHWHAPRIFAAALYAIRLHGDNQ